MDPLILIIYGAPLVVALWWYARRRRGRAREGARRLDEARQSGLMEPPSMHPVFDPVRCIGSGACVTACPEQAIGFVDNRPQLVNPSACIGHGACQAACPLEAIHLVFGTQRRGMELPAVDPRFETNVPGLFIAGELGGMGLIHKATEQGRQAMEEVGRRRGDGPDLDVVIVGSGPAGLSASLRAKELGLRFVTLEQETSLGGSVFHYPRNKIAMTSSMRLPQVGRVRLGEISKETLLAFWQEVVRKTGLQIRFREPMQSIERDGNAFVVSTPGQRYRARCVLLCVGRRGSPRKLEVPGEDLPKVVYRLVDPEQYRGQRVLVVGGGDSAVEAALALCAQPDTGVTLSYRGDAFNRIKEKNREALRAAVAAGRIDTFLGSEVIGIKPGEVALRVLERAERLANDAVIICAGGELPTRMLRDLGVEIEVHHGEMMA